MKVTNILSIVALAALLAGSVTAIGGQGVHWFAPSNQHHATLAVADANGLLPGSKLLLRGVPIGEVTQVQSSAREVGIEFRFGAAYRIPLDSSFRIESLSALGESYLAIAPNTEHGPYIADHQHIRTDTATAPATFGELSAALTRLLNDTSPDKVNALVGELQSALPADAMVPNNLARFGTLLTTTLLMSYGPIRDLIADSQSLLDRSAGTGPAIAAVSDPLRNAGTGFAAMAETSIEMMHSNDYPRVVEIGPLAFFSGLQRFEDRVGGDVAKLSTPLLPAVQSGAAAMGSVDVSRLLDSAMAAVAVPGSVTLRVAGPK
ncbi:MlaD family protein [Nocardia sp. NPDC050175]|uniref:MlaD family protein n=1 Tax=Nocardia sp. NPDC050175 TaxID=3364317 RepID=UPI0037AE7B71